MSSYDLILQIVVFTIKTLYTVHDDPILIDYWDASVRCNHYIYTQIILPSNRQLMGTCPFIPNHHVEVAQLLAREVHGQWIL